MKYDILQGDSVVLLPSLAVASVQAFITSPPYWGLRDYGIPPTAWPEVRYRPMSGIDFEVVIPAMVCCLGLEPTPEAFIGHLLHVFRLAAPALKQDGTCWVNLGDTYSAGKSKAGYISTGHDLGFSPNQSAPRVPGLAPKNLVGIPWRLALAMQADGWYLRQDIIWHKPNAMPEPCKDRCTKAHEYFFLFSKSKKYYFNADAIQEPRASNEDANGFRGGAYVNGSTFDNSAGGKRTSAGNVERPQLRRARELAAEAGLTDAHIDAIRACGITDTGKTRETQTGAGNNTSERQRLAEEAKQALGGYYREFLLNGTRNKRSVWTVATKPYSEAHFATFPPALVEPCILAGTRPGDTVCDMFSGSGTTGQEAMRLGRNYIGIEAKPENVALHGKRVGGLQFALTLPTTLLK